MFNPFLRSPRFESVKRILGEVGMKSNANTVNDERPYAFEFEAEILQAASVSWVRKPKEGDTSPAREFHIIKYSFSSPVVSGVLIEWLDEAAQPKVVKGPCKIRFRQLRPSKQMFGFYELAGYPVFE